MTVFAKISVFVLLFIRTPFTQFVFVSIKISSTLARISTLPPLSSIACIKHVAIDFEPPSGKAPPSFGNPIDKAAVITKECRSGGDPVSIQSPNKYAAIFLLLIKLVVTSSPVCFAYLVNVVKNRYLYIFRNHIGNTFDINHNGIQLLIIVAIFKNSFNSC